jgi:hypothetical protein
MKTYITLTKKVVQFWELFYLLNYLEKKKYVKISLIKKNRTGKCGLQRMSFRSLIAPKDTSRILNTTCLFFQKPNSRKQGNRVFVIVKAPYQKKPDKVIILQ